MANISIHPASATTNSAMPTPVIMSEVTNPHTMKVIPSAKVTGHTHGSGSSAGCGTSIPEAIPGSKV